MRRSPGSSGRRPGKRVVGFAAFVLAALGTAGGAGAQPDTAALAAEVRQREQAFARTMAERDHAAFTTFLSDEAVFVGREVLRGRQAVATGWKRFFEGDRAPFSWEPATVEVLASGALALSSGPVLDPQGVRVSTFNSVWRREPDGVWRIVFDNGCPQVLSRRPAACRGCEPPGASLAAR
jgi:ketosteroid isomerase-like protein